MKAVAVLCRAHWRHHWRSLTGLAALVGLASAAALIPLAGARRSASVVDRQLVAIDAHDATLQVPDEGDEGIDHHLLARVAALPEVAAISRFGIFFVSPEGSDALQGADALASGTHLDAGSRVVKALLQQGRLPAEDKVDEVALSVGVAQSMGVGVGDLARLQSLSPRQLEAVFTGEEVGPPAGPRVSLRVTGILRPAPSEVRLDIALTPAFAAVHGPDIAHFDNLFRVWLRHGEADVESFVASVTDLNGGLDELFVASTIEGIKNTRAPVRAQAVGLALIALILGAAGLVASGQAMRRHLATTSESRASLLALGLTQSERALMATGSVLPSLAGVLLLGPALAVAASGLLPFGLARDVEPAPGLRVDTILLPAAAGLALLLVVALVAAAWSQVRSGEERSRSLSPSRLVSLGPSATVGLTFALHGERGSRMVPVRSTIAATLVSSMLIVGAIGFSASLNRFVTTPSRQGWNWDLALRLGRRGRR